jgi:hypothetical protein
MPCGSCGKAGHNAKTCGQPPAKVPKPATARAAKAAALVAAETNGNGTAARVRELVAQVAAGKAAEAELAEIRKSLA